MPAPLHYGLTLERSRRGTMPRMRWTRELPPHVAIRWTR